MSGLVPGGLVPAGAEGRQGVAGSTSILRSTGTSPVGTPYQGFVNLRINSRLILPAEAHYH